MRKVWELMENKGGNYIFPFLWMHGEDHEIIREEIDKIQECGIREICLESRPHPDFCGPRWWSDVDFIINEAKKRNMRVWVLDDVKFPTGYANGAFKTKYPELAKVYLAERHMDIIGPATDNAVLINPFLGKDGKLLKVIACRKPDTETTSVSGEGMIDLTDRVHEGFVYFDLPEGRYRLFVLFTTREQGGRDFYMNLIDGRSVKVLIEEVYERHYERYKDDFGKTFAGFFSDEPEFGNTPGYDFHEVLGKNNVKLPWSEELSDALKEQWGEDFGKNLIALWYDMGEKTPSIRSQYMETVTKLVYKCFSGQIGKWCEEHGVEYIGHIIEDDNAHARLGCSIGHYFREQKGQHMSGVDVVHFQIVPGFYEKIHQWLSWDGDGEFFHYGLAKMGSSCAHIDPKKKGRALCELFGNYGWAEGVSFMKWLANHMLVRGINRFVPHAFSPRFPDRDCPPHFYARGNNPQFKHFTLLMKYMNRVAHLISGGVHISDAAVLYHGESEWSGGKTMLFQKPVRKLLEAQLDCDVVPADIFGEDHVRVEEKKLRINQETYGCLILPYSQYVPKTAVDFIIKAANDGLQVYVIDDLPIADTNGRPLPIEFANAVRVVKLEDIARVIKTNQVTEIVCGKELPNLRFYCYEHEDEKVYLFFNENPFEAVDTQIRILRGEYGAIEEYDAVQNRISKYLMADNSFRLFLEPGQLRIFIPAADVSGAEGFPVLAEAKEINCDWHVSLCEAGSGPKFEKKMVLKASMGLPNMNGPEYFSGFSGTFRYEGSFVINTEDMGKNGSRRCFLYLPGIGDCAEVTVNGKNVGMILGAPDRIEITDALEYGENKLIIDITNTLVWKLRDPVSSFMQLNPTGLTKKPVLEFYE